MKEPDIDRQRGRQQTEPDKCPRCGNPNAPFTAFVERHDSKPDEIGKRCNDCGFPVYRVRDGWEW